MTSQLKTPVCGPDQVIIQTAHSFMASAALGAMARLGVADLLADGPMTMDALAKQLKANTDALTRTMRLLASIGIFQETAPGVFGNNDASQFLRSDVEGSQKDIVSFWTDPFHFKAYADMVPTILDGRTAAEHVWGKPIFEVFAEDPEEQRLFDNAMTNLSQQAVPPILEAYDFSGIDTLVDVAGGHGMLLTSIMQKHPSMKGIVFDLPHVVNGARPRIQSLGLADRCTIESGDFFKAVPSGDAIIMKHIIHDWDDEHAASILKNCKKALEGKPNAKVLLVEMLLSGNSEPEPSKFLDIEMLVLAGGRERTEEQFAKLFSAAGLKLNKIVRTKSPFVVIEAVPA
jgi:hypothetical protein